MIGVILCGLLDDLDREEGEDIIIASYVKRLGQLFIKITLITILATSLQYPTQVDVYVLLPPKIVSIMTLAAAGSLVLIGGLFAIFSIYVYERHRSPYEARRGILA